MPIYTFENAKNDEISLYLQLIYGMVDSQKNQKDQKKGTSNIETGSGVLLIKSNLKYEFRYFT